MPDRQAQLDDAAAAALWMLALQRDPAREHMGALYARGEDIARTETVSSGSGANVRGKLTVPKGMLRGLFHNHPGAPERDIYGRIFSDDDKAQARRLGVPSYISTPTGAVRKFDPEANETTDVLARFPIEEYLRFLALKRSSANPIAAAIIAEQNAKRTSAGSQR